MIDLYITEESDRRWAFRLADNPVLACKSPSNDIQLEDRLVSRVHLKISMRDGKYSILDMQRSNGTTIDGSRIRPLVECNVAEGTPIRIGKTAISLGKPCPRSLLPQTNN
jgi:pSer/pThr/pTyr-binding forkhead associated (FHA) protein